MTLRERFAGWIGGRKATEAVGFHSPTAMSFGPGIGNQPSDSTLLQENLGVSDMATRAIANRVSTLNPQVKVVRRASDGTEVDEILDDHPLKALLDRPHPNFSRAQLLRLTTQWVVTTGKGYWLKVGNGLGVPTELHPIPPAQCWPNFEKGIITSFTIQDGAGKQSPIDPETVVYFFLPDPENPWGAEGYLGPAGITADSLKFSGQHLRSHYQNDATPKSYLKPGADAPEFGETAKKAFLQEWRTKYHQRLGTDRGGPGMLPTGYDLIELSLASGADIVPLLEHWRDEQLMGFGVPRSILGQVVSGDRSSAETNQYVFDLHTIYPLASLISEALTYQLAPDFDSALIVAFEDFVSPDKAFKLQQEQSDLDRKVRSVNTVLRDRGFDPVDWGELPVGQIGQIPYDGMGFDLAEDQGDALGGEEEEERRRAAQVQGQEEEGQEGQARVGRAAFFAKSAEWLRQVAREKKYVPTFRKEMLGIFAIQQRTTLKNLKAFEPRARVAADDIFTPEDWAKLFELRLEPIREDAFLATANETFAGLGVEAEFVFTDAMREQLKRQGAQLIKDANATTKKLIRRHLELGVAEGESIEDLAKRVKTAFDVRRHHARTIARTEVLKSSQTAQIESFEQSEVVQQKQWNNSLDAAVRDTHYLAQPVVELRESFTLQRPKGGTEEAAAPGLGAGGVQLSAGNAINCRCFVTPVVEE